MQEALLLGKYHGHIELPAFGAIDWPLAVAGMDVLLTLVRVGTRRVYQERLHARIARDFPLSYLSEWRWSGRYGSTLTLAWLLHD